MIETTNGVIINFWSRFLDYLPDFFGGIVILFAGFFLSALLKKILHTLLSFFRVDVLLHKTKVLSQKEFRIWQGVLIELVRWTVIILFLIPTLETWGLSQATNVLNTFLFYLPNVIVAVVMGFIGIIISNLSADLVRQSMKSVGVSSANTLSAFTKSTILFFTVLIMLNQLGVAQDLIRIFFTGIVAMIAIAGGLAFGLGGKDVAKELLEELKKKLAK